MDGNWESKTVVYSSNYIESFFGSLYFEQLKFVNAKINVLTFYHTAQSSFANWIKR